MATKKKATKASAKPKAKKENFTVWVYPEQAARVRRAVGFASKRSGFPIPVSVWLNTIVMRAVEEEEEIAKAIPEVDR